MSGVALGAVKDVLDRNGFKPIEKSQVAVDVRGDFSLEELLGSYSQITITGPRES